MTPLLTALSNLRDSSRSSATAASVTCAATDSLNLRMAVFREDLTALLRRRRFSFCRLRLIWDLMFATRQALSVCPVRVWIHDLERRRRQARATEYFTSSTLDAKNQPSRP